MNNKKEIGSLEFIVLTACIMLLTAVAIDIMLPAFNDVRENFGLGPDSTATAHIVTFFFLGQIGQIFFGPLSDRYGRIAILRTGFVLYITGCIAAALLPNLDLILAARFVVGLGAAAMGVCATAGVRDRFSGDKMARTMSLILTIFLGVPVVAPIVGSLILSLTSWQVVFLTPPLLAVPIFLWSLRLKESLPPERRLKLDVSSLLKSARLVTGNRVFVRYTAITTILFGIFSSYISSSERIITEIYGRPDLFVWIFGAIGVTMAIFTFLNAQLVGRFGAQRTIRNLLTAYLGLTVVLFVLTVLMNGTPNIFIFFAFIGLLQGINVAVEPNSSALALEPLGSTAGMAAAIYGASFFVVGSIVGSFIDRLLINTVTPMAVGYVIVGLLTAALVYSRRTTPVTAVTAAETGD
jgi:MFS transporter, DHA1 family, multidrug resistance protein